MRIIQPCEVCRFSVILYYKREIDIRFGCWGCNFPFVMQNDWKLQTSQGSIFLILQHFATKLWNITNFVMLFQAVMKYLSRLAYIKILVIRGKVYWKQKFPSQCTSEDWRMFLHEYLVVFICLNAFVGSVWSNSYKDKSK
jgi:hypothetical protein